MRLSLLPNSSIPAYKQLYDQLFKEIVSGELVAGYALPPIRTVAKELGISVITVRSAWDALLSDGLIETVAGSGCFVAELSYDERLERKKEALKKPAEELAALAKSLGFSAEETEKLVRDSF